VSNQREREGEREKREGEREWKERKRTQRALDIP